MTHVDAAREEMRHHARVLVGLVLLPALACTGRLGAGAARSGIPRSADRGYAMGRLSRGPTVDDPNDNDRINFELIGSLMSSGTDSA